MNIQKLPCMMALLGLIACQPGPIVDPTPTPFQTSSGISSISGKVEGWNRGVQKIATQFSNTPSSKPIGNGSIDANGQFRLDLPALIPEADLSTFTGCAGMVITPDFKNGLIPGVGVYSETGALLGLIVYANTNFSFTGSTPAVGQTSIGWIYSVKNNSAQGTCPGPQNSTSSYDLDLKPGWNSLIGEYTTTTNIAYRSGQSSSIFTWRFAAR